MLASLYIPISHEEESIAFIISTLSKMGNINHHYLDIDENYLIFIDGYKECIVSINHILEYKIEPMQFPFMVDLKDNNGEDLTILIAYLFCHYFGYIVYNDCGVLGKQENYTSLELLDLIQSSNYYDLIQQM
ncbi:hypothetical protein [Alysiella crassa]|uniref:Uncharacterized protein n=1 Tax=Alysiella crassa TaxID=153491 RepID=A0A376BML6_9NEIS|nr:hypothetical protein [Alysiella crassa]UOP06966.1 hypothetical protein LVJ80_00235 [Alysiella crassa]SSY70898.1 Uncharacterised protein [Alysiella crassa]